MDIQASSKIDQYKQVHSQSHYGSAGIEHRDSVVFAIIETGARSVLDYGCGQGRLHEALGEISGLSVHRFDPAIPAIDHLTVDHVDLIVSTDVLEHVPESELAAMFQRMRELASNVFWTIATRPAKLILPNGENAHCTIRPAAWWLERIREYFADAHLVFDAPGNFCVLTSWRPRDSLLYVRMERSARLRRRIEKVALLRLLRKAQHLEL